MGLSFEQRVNGRRPFRASEDIYPGTLQLSWFKFNIMSKQFDRQLTSGPAHINSTQ